MNFFSREREFFFQYHPDFAAISTIIDKTKTISPDLTSTEFKGDGEKKFLARGNDSRGFEAKSPQDFLVLEKHT